MIVNNKASFPVIAFCWHYGGKDFGKDVLIQPGESADVPGPYLGEMGGGDCHAIVPGNITCQDTPDDGIRFQILRGSQLRLGSDDKDMGVCIRHHEEDFVQ